VLPLEILLASNPAAAADLAGPNRKNAPEYIWLLVKKFHKQTRVPIGEVVPQTDLEQLCENRQKRINGQPQYVYTLRAQVALMEMLVRLINCPIIAGGTAYAENDRPLDDSEIWCMRNDVLVFRKNGLQEKSYSKQHLVPFSEEVPLKYGVTPAYELLRSVVPESMPQLQPGRDSYRILLDSRDGAKQYELITPICFEGTIPQVCRKMVADGPKKNLIMVNISNDGWFTHLKGIGGFFSSSALTRGKISDYTGTTEQSQHLSHSVFRAIETRVPVVRAVNTGISADISSNGKIETVLETVDDSGRKDTMVAGVLKVSTKTDRRSTIYAAVGDLFAIAVSVAACGIIILLVFRREKESENL
ncbi:MAG: hypothetical protein MI745_00940, partial [Pseudomonadales bacterium]|nr:hypothetical protein [Pseudomonadales bacterium]